MPDPRPARCYHCNAPLPSAGGPFICERCLNRLSARPARPPRWEQAGFCEFCPATGPASCAVCGAYHPGDEALAEDAPAPAA